MSRGPISSAPARRALLCAGLLCVGLLALSGCGPGDDDNGRTPDGGAPGVPPGDDAGPTPGAQQPAGWDEALSLQPLVDENPDPGIVEVRLAARVAEVELTPGVRTEMWTYNGSVPGPLIRVKEGDRLIVHLENQLPAPTTIHWHGLRVPAAMDGTEAMQSPVQPNGRFTYDFVVPDAGTYWYHPHYDSSEQVGYGLYGALVVDARDRASEPPLGDDLVLVLSDASRLEDGSLAPGDDLGWFGDYFGREGQLLLVNGRGDRPTLRARAGVPQRWRLINASRARYQELTVPGQRLVRVGGDAGLLSSPEPIDKILLAPGERMEVYLLPEPQEDGPVFVSWSDFNRVVAPNPRPDEDLFRLVVEDAAEGAPDVAPLPETLREIEPVDVTGARVQRVELGEKVVGGDGVLTINGMSHDEVMEHGHHLTASANTIELWEVENATGYDHPFHLHGFFFQVLDVDGVPPAVREWKDTLNLRGHQTARLAVVFDDRPGMWMLHCHILDHAELGMMNMVEVR